MKYLKSNLIKLTTFLTLLAILFTSVTISSISIKALQTTSNEINPKLKYITPEEMEHLISTHESNIQPANLFPDFVAFTISRMSNGNARVVLMNEGFPFDRCDVNGVITLYSDRGMVVGRGIIAEPRLIYEIARVNIIQPIGRVFSYAEYDLTVSDGDAGTRYQGKIYP